MSCIWSEYLEQSLLAGGSEHVTSGSFTGALYGCLMNLFTANLTFTPQTPLATFTAAIPTYADYAAIACPFGTPYRRAAGGIAINTGMIEWQESSTITSVLIYGYFITDSGAANWLSAELFVGGPLPLIDALSAVLVAAELCIGGPDLGTCSIGS